MTRINVKKANKQPNRKPQRKEAKQMTLLGQALRTLGGLGGSSIGAMMGAPGTGGAVGTSLGAAISKWLGSGDYTVGTNSLVKSSLRAADSIPHMHNNDQTVTIRHKEFLGEIKSSIGFTVQNSYQLNPGNSHAFPWLSTIATSFQEYKFKGIVFHFVPSSGSAISGTSPSLGTVMMQTSYRATDNAPGNKVELLNEYCATECVPSDTFAHPIECDPKENPFNVLYVRSGNLPATETRMMYDLGVTHICTSGQLAANNVLGDLWVTYEIELKKPIVASEVTSPYKSAQIVVGSPVSGAAYYDGVQTKQGSLDVTCSGRNVVFPKGSQGKWLIYTRLTPSTTFGVLKMYLSGPSVSNCTLVNYSAGPDQWFGTDSSGSPVNYSCIGVAAIEISDPTAIASVAFSNGTINGTVQSTELLITPFVKNA